MIELKIPIDRVKEFISLSKFIQSEKLDISPILKNIKVEVLFGTCKLIKSNNNSFLEYCFDLDSDDCEFLIDISYIEHFALNSKETNLSIKIKESVANLTDGYIKQKRNLSAYNIEEFPKLPEFNEDTVALTENFLRALDSAKAHSGKDKLVERFLPVYVDNGTIYASSGQVMYINNFKIETPSFALTPNECQLLSSFKSILYSKSDNYNTYKNGNIVYGFINPEGATGFPYEIISSQFKDGATVIINKEDFINFCISTKTFAGTDFCASTCNINKDSAELIYQDKEKDEENRADIFVKSEDEFSFNFNPAQIIEIFKSIPYKSLNLIENDNFIIIKSDEDKNYSGLFMKTFI